MSSEDFRRRRKSFSFFLFLSLRNLAVGRAGKRGRPEKTTSSPPCSFVVFLAWQDTQCTVRTPTRDRQKIKMLLKLVGGGGGKGGHAFPPHFSTMSIQRVVSTCFLPTPSRTDSSSDKGDLARQTISFPHKNFLYFPLFFCHFSVAVFSPPWAGEKEKGCTDCLWRRKKRESVPKGKKERKERNFSKMEPFRLGDKNVPNQRRKNLVVSRSYEGEE